MFIKREESVKQIKVSTTIQELEEICKKSKANEDEVRQAILRILANDIERMNSIQSIGSRLKDRKTITLALPIANDIKSLEDLAKKLKSGDLATGFNQWKQNNQNAWSSINDVSPKMIASIENIVQKEFVKSEVTKNSHQSMMDLFREHSQISNLNPSSSSSSSSSRMTDNALFDISLDGINLNFINSNNSSSPSHPESLPSNYTDKNQQTSKTFSTLQVFVNPECSKQILKCIAEQSEPDLIPPNISKDPIPENLNSQDLLAQLTNRMHEFEQLMHPHPAWKCSRVNPKDENEKTIVKIDYYPDLMPKGKALDQMLEEKEANSLVVRKLSILSGALTLLDSHSFITANPETKQKIADYIRQESNAIISAAIRKDNNVDIKKDFASFINKLNTDIARIADIKKEDIENEVSDPIRKAERYFTAEYNKNMVLMAVTHHDDGSKVVQMDIEFNQLTTQQRQEYMQIRDAEHPPLWFAALMKSEQQWYLDRVPESMGDTKKWTEFEQLFKSSAMQHAPGLSNARANFGMVQENDGTIKTLISGLQSGVPANYEMPQQEMEKHAKANIEQGCELAIKLSMHNYQQLWGDFVGYKPLIPVLFQSLLSPEVLIDKADSELIEAQSTGMQSAKRDLDCPTHNIMLHNNPTNAYRAGDAFKSNLHALKTKVLSKVSSTADRDDNATWDALSLVRGEARNFLSKVLENFKLSDKEQAALDAIRLTNKQLEPGQKQALMDLLKSDRLGLSDDQKTALRKIVVAENECRVLAVSQSNFLFGSVHNKEEHKIALKRFLLEAMGGVIVNNCKSGKDRTGLSEVYQHAMTHYFDKHGDIFSFNADKTAKDRFSKIWGDLFASQKIQKAGGNNTPGSDGIKDNEYSAIVSPFLIKDEVTSKLHKSNYDTAGLNKPPLYTELEKKNKKNKDNVQMVETPTTLSMN